MRICHVITDLDPASGGPPVVASRLAAAQAAAGHEVRLLCYAKPGDQERIDAMLHGMPGGDALIIEAQEPGGRVERTLTRRANARLQALIEQLDVVHAHGVWDPILRASVMIARRAGVPGVVAPHGMLDEWALSEKPLKKKLALTLAYNAMLKAASMFHALSAYEQDCTRGFIRGLGAETPVEVIPNGVFLDEIDPLPEPGAFYAKHPELNGEPYVVFLSRLHPVKGLPILVEAFASAIRDSAPARLVIAGPDAGAQGDAEQAARDHGVADRVHFVGPQWGSDKYAALRDARCFALPSEHEGFSMAICEALACGLPVAISDTCFFPDVATEGAGFVTPREAPPLAEALKTLLTDEPKARAKGEAGRRLVEQRYTWPKIAERAVGLYEGLSGD
ncbi:MAG: glycosyltransferase [Planctomycetota bacterium]